MHDIRLIRENPAAFDAALARRGLAPMSAELLALDEKRRAISTQVQVCQARRNEASKLIGQAMAQKDMDKAEALKAEVAELKERMPALEAEDRAVGEELQDKLLAIPNLPADDVPQGADENDNVEQARWGEPRQFDFTPQDHADFGPALGLDFETGALLSGARFTFLKGQIARLHRALGHFMLDTQSTTNGYVECNVPLLVKDNVVVGTGQLPKFADDLFATQLTYDMDWLDTQVDAVLAETENVIGTLPDRGVLRSQLRENYIKYTKSPQISRRWLIPTAEVSLTNTVREQIVPDASLPLRFTALTPCFRSEAGSAGRDTRGFIRQHQFEKVELVAICRPEDSEAEHQRMLAAAEGILQALALPYRRVLLCTGDMGFGARKTYDLEVWLPSQQTYREISSISNCGDFQARRMNARYKPEGVSGLRSKSGSSSQSGSRSGAQSQSSSRSGAQSLSGATSGSTRFLHTLNGSGLAVGRTLVAVLENYQQADGSVIVPDVLAPYMGGIDKLTPR